MEKNRKDRTHLAFKGGGGAGARGGGRGGGGGVGGGGLLRIWSDTNSVVNFYWNRQN